MPHPSSDRITLLPALNPGTILSCPECSMGLYMLTQKVTREGEHWKTTESVMGVMVSPTGAEIQLCAQIENLC